MMEHDIARDPVVVKFFRLLSQHTDCTMEHFINTAREYNHNEELLSVEDVLYAVVNHRDHATDMIISWEDTGQDEYWSYINNTIIDNWEE